MTKREISRALAIFMGRRTRAASGAKLAAGNKNKPGINAGRAGSWQHDMEHDTKPLMSCPQSMGDEFWAGAR